MPIYFHFCIVFVLHFGHWLDSENICTIFKTRNGFLYCSLNVFPQLQFS